MGKVHCFFAVFFLLCFSVVDVQATSVFVAKDITVNEIAQTTVKAKENAYIKAKRTAWKDVLQHLSLLDVNRVSYIKDATIDAFIQAIEVKQEKARNKHYIATLNIYFNLVRVRAYLKERRIPFAVERSFPILLIPVYDKDGITKIFETGNQWEQALQTTHRNGGLVPTVLLAGGAKNSMKIDLSTVYDTDLVERVAKENGADGAIVTRLRIIRTAGNKKRAVVDWYAFGTELSPLPRTFAQTIGSKQGKIAQQMAVRFYTHLEESWRKKLLSDQQQGKNVQKMLFATESIEDWQGLKAKLESMSFVENISPFSLRAGIFGVNVTYMGSQKRIKKYLMHLGYTITPGRQDDAYVWAVSRP